jgi:hypothetical protein
MNNEQETSVVDTENPAVAESESASVTDVAPEQAPPAKHAEGTQTLDENVILAHPRVKGMTRKINELKDENRRLREQATLSADDRKRLATLERAIEQMIDTPDAESDQSLFDDSQRKPKRAKMSDIRSQVEKQFAENEAKAAQLSAADRTKAEQIGVVLKSTGLPAEDPRFDLVRETWATGDHDGALATARALAVVLRVSPPQPAASQPKSTKTQELKDSGLLKTDAAAPSGGGYSNASDIRKAIISGKITAEQASELERQGRW